MLAALKSGWKEYPRQYWLMFFGMLISTIGSSMIWPFLMIYVSGKLHQPMTLVASLFMLNSAVGLFFNFIVGPLADKVGRKWVLVIALIGMGIVYLLQNEAGTFLAFAIAQGMMGAFNPMYRVAADAMLADLIPQEKRTEAYSLMRMSNNLGVALGPTIGGFLAARSYSTIFYIAAAGLTTYGIMMAIFARETLPVHTGPVERMAGEGSFGGYKLILGDGHYRTLIIGFLFCMVSSTFLWILLPVYAKTNFGIPENLYGFIPATNALMVVFFQLPVTRLTKTRNPILMMGLGALFYATGVGAVYFGSGFWFFWLCMVIITIGELILIPTVTTYIANIAPSHMRGRYMSLYNLAAGSATGLGPVIGGWLNDNVGPRAIWVGGFVIGIISPGVFSWLWRKKKNTLSK